MADNVIANSGVGGATFATDDVGGIHFPRSKLVWGADGTATDASAAAPLPVVQTGALPAGTAAIGKLAANSGVDIGTVTANAGTNLNTSALALDSSVGTTNTEIGGLTETAPATDTGSSGLNGRLQRVAQRLTSLIALLPAALTGSGNLKIALVESTATATVSGTVTANAGTNLNTSALALDATLATTNTDLGGVTETAPATDTASSGLNGRLQRIAQRLTSLIALLPSALVGGRLDVNTGSINGVATTMGNGASGTGVQRVTIASDSTGQVALAAGSNLIGRVNPEPQTANGLSISRLISAATTNETEAKATAGQLYGVTAHNINAAVRYLKIYDNTAAGTSIGTTTPKMTLPIPGNTAGAGFMLDTGGMGIAFGTGITYGLTTGVADSDTAAVAANEIVCHILFK